MALATGPHRRAMASIAARGGAATSALDRLDQQIASLQAAYDLDMLAAGAAAGADPSLRRRGLELEAFKALRDQGRAQVVQGSRLTTLRYQEGFIAYLKLCLIVGAILAAPFFLYELWRFVAEGLRDSERQAVRLYLPLSLVMFVLGVAFGFLVLVPLGLSYLAGYADPELVQTGITLDAYLSLVAILTLLLGLLFELPLGMALAARLGFTSAKGFAAWRKYFVLTAFIVAGILTPPDPVTQLLMAAPLLGLYELGIVIARWTQRASPEAQP